MKEEFVSRQQLNLLSERVLQAEKTDATKELNLYMWDLFMKKNLLPMHIMLVGSGGSYPAAVFGKYAIIRDFYTTNVEAVTPQTAIRIITQCDQFCASDWHPKYDLVIGISYSGKTPDMKFVSEMCVTRGYPFVLLTGAEKSTLSEIYSKNDLIKIISYFNEDDNTGPEKGLISMVATFTPVVIFDDNWSWKQSLMYQDFLSEGEKFVSELNIPEMAKMLQKYPTIHVFYEWDTLPTASDIESKFTESGIANVILHEKKNFSHGRCTSLYNQNFAIVINLTIYATSFLTEENNDSKSYKYKYDRELAEFLKDRCKAKSAQYLEIGIATNEPKEWNVEVMAKLPYLITTIGEEMEIDISRPLSPYPSEAKPLYNYTGEF